MTSPVPRSVALNPGPFGGIPARRHPTRRGERGGAEESRTRLGAGAGWRKSGDPLGSTFYNEHTYIYIYIHTRWCPIVS